MFFICQGASPRLSDKYAVSTVTIKESSDPYGILAIEPTEQSVTEQFTQVMLKIVRTGKLQDMLNSLEHLMVVIISMLLFILLSNPACVSLTQAQASTGVCLQVINTYRYPYPINKWTVRMDYKCLN